MLSQQFHTGQPHLMSCLLMDLLNGSSAFTLSTALLTAECKFFSILNDDHEDLPCPIAGLFSSPVSAYLLRTTFGAHPSLRPPPVLDTHWIPFIHLRSDAFPKQQQDGGTEVPFPESGTNPSQLRRSSQKNLFFIIKATILQRMEVRLTGLPSPRASPQPTG